jgi:thioesterase domain-containing protein/acyl carrier protein
LALQSAPHRDQVRLINTGPSLFDALLRTGGLPAGVTTVILAGEKLPRLLATRIFEKAPGIRLLNCYGPTETTVYSSWALIDPASLSEPAIGRAIWNTRLFVLDSGRELVPRGAEGELFIGGAGVARGYLGRPELTTERFLSNPFCPGKIYRTGDRVRWRADGELEFMGRADDQIKINGIRIEPGEIEACLLALPGVASAVVTLYADTGLIAYLVGSPGVEITTEVVRAALERQLPRHMVPTIFVWLDAMPMTPNGKLDRKSLPAPSREQTQRPLDDPPETKLEREVAEIWEELLQVSPIGIQTDFFDLGGDSLALVSLFAVIEAQYGVRLTGEVLSGGLTVAGLADLLARDEPRQSKTDPIVALQPLGHQPPFFCVHGIAGDVVHLHRLAIHMGANRPFYAFRQPPDLPRTESINQLAAHYVAAMLMRQSTGPFYLGGHSFGAIVAYEMALQLVRQGHEIGLLAIIDQRRPAWQLTARKALSVLPQIFMDMPGRVRDELARVPSAERVRHIQRTVLRWLKMALGQSPDALSKFGLDRSETELTSIFDANLRALRAYQPSPLPAPITLFRASVQALSHLALDSTLGWSDLSEAEVRVHKVPGNHGSITTEPLVRNLASLLSSELDAACFQSLLSTRHHRSLVGIFSSAF